MNIVTFKWKKPDTGYKLKTQVSYGSKHVNVLYQSIKRNTTLDFNFYCITDDPSGLNPDIKYIPLWNKCINLGGCYNRLFVFSKEMRKIIGKRFLSIDLDVVITGNIDKLLLRNEDFIINEYRSKNNFQHKYNGGMFMMNSGCRDQVWNEFDYHNSPKIIEQQKNKRILTGSDQAWIQYVLGDNEHLFTSEEDGVYDYNHLGPVLPNNCRIVFFPGKNDPEIEMNKLP